MRKFQPVASIDPAVVETADITGEVLIDGRIRPRAQAHDDVVARLEDHIAALRAPGADRCGAIQLPCTCLVQEVLREQRAYRAEVDDIRRPRVRQVAALELADVGAVAAFADVQHRILHHHIHEPYAACAEDAAVGDVEHVTTEVLHRVEALRLHVARVLPALGERVVLQFAFTRLVADGTVERMIDQQELQHALARLPGLRRVHVHHLPFTDGCRAGRRQLRELLHLDEAHAADTGHRQRRMVAVVRDQHARRPCRLDQVRAGRHDDGAPLDRERHHARICRCDGCRHVRLPLPSRRSAPSPTTGSSGSSPRTHAGTSSAH